jgi:hypothetical protein
MAKTDNFTVATRRGAAMIKSQPHAVSARYDRRSGRVIVALSNRLDIAFCAEDAQGLAGHKPAELTEIEISPSGMGLYFPKVDADIYLPALLEGFLGSKKWMASRLGSVGGKSKSVAKASAAKKNGRLGGRPKKKAVA